MWTPRATIVLPTLGLLASSACADHDITVAGHDFHLSPAYVAERTRDEADNPLYQVNVTNLSHPCDFWGTQEPVATAQDDLWFQLNPSGPVYLDGSRTPGLAAALICISDTIPCGATIPTHQIFHTSGDEVFEVDGDRLRVSLRFTHEGWPPGIVRPLDEPFDVELETSYKSCESAAGGARTSLPRRCHDKREQLKRSQT